MLQCVLYKCLSGDLYKSLNISDRRTNMIVYPHNYFTVYRLELQFNLVSVKMSKIFIRHLHLVYKLLKITSNPRSKNGCITDKHQQAAPEKRERPRRSDEFNTFNTLMQKRISTKTNNTKHFKIELPTLAEQKNWEEFSLCWEVKAAAVWDFTGNEVCN